MALYPWPYELYLYNPYYDPTSGVYRDALEDYLDGYWPVNTLDTPVRDLRGWDEGDKGKFVTHVDVQQFKPEEISVKVSEDDKTVTIEAKHEEKIDEHGSVSRHFVRKFTLPEDCDGGKIQSQLSSDGVLTIAAPKISEGEQNECREIPIKKTGSLEAGERKRRASKLKNKCHLL